MQKFYYDFGWTKPGFYVLSIQTPLLKSMVSAKKACRLPIGIGMLVRYD
jgi:hypothetical protein